MIQPYLANTTQDLQQILHLQNENLVAYALTRLQECRIPYAGS